MQTLRALTLSLAALVSGAAFAGEPVMIAKADTAPKVATVRVEPAAAADSYMALADAERRIMGYDDFDTVLAEALATPTAAGPAVTLVSRAAIEAFAASRMGGLMP